MQCGEELPVVPLKSAVLQPSPAALLQRTIQYRLSQSQMTPGSRARRRLFSSVDADDVSRFVKRELAAVRAADRRRYNFDFEKMQPLEGRFQWERVGSTGQTSPCENTPVHRSARRLELDCPRTGTAGPDAKQRRAGDKDGAKTTHPAHQQCCAKDRVCFAATDDSTKVLKEASQLRCGRDQDLRHKAEAEAERLTNNPLRQTTLSDLWQTRKRSCTWEANENQPKKCIRSTLPPSAQPQLAGRYSGDEQGTVHRRQTILSQLQKQSVVPS